MSQLDNIIEKKKFKQINYEERVLIEYLFNKEKENISKIALKLGRNKSTISRELKKGKVELLNSDYSYRIDYSADLAEKKTKEKALNKGPGLKIGKDLELSKYIDKQISNKYSPEVIAFEIKKDYKFKIKLHWKTIYNYLDKGILESSREDLVYGNYRKKAKRKKESNRIKIFKEGRKIEDRPEEVESREEFGHWEMDLVEGSRNGQGKSLLVLSERKTRKEIIELLKDKKQESVIKALNRIEKRLGVLNFRKEFKTITTDNGMEFLDYEGIEKSYTGVKEKRTNQYYATAYCSWQRGTNENINKMIRRFLPKGTSFDKLKSKDVKEIEDWINNYPRKIFEFKSSNEIYEEIKIEKTA